MLAMYRPVPKTIITDVVRLVHDFPFSTLNGYFVWMASNRADVIGPYDRQNVRNYLYGRVEKLEIDLPFETEIIVSDSHRYLFNEWRRYNSRISNSVPVKSGETIEQYGQRCDLEASVEYQWALAKKRVYYELDNDDFQLICELWNGLSNRFAYAPKTIFYVYLHMREEFLSVSANNFYVPQGLDMADQLLAEIAKRLKL